MMKALYAIMFGMVLLLVFGCGKADVTGSVVEDIENPETIEEPEADIGPEPTPVREAAPKQAEEVDNEECKVIEEEKARDACYIKVGIDEDDARYCDKVSNRQECIVMIEAQDDFEMGW